MEEKTKNIIYSVIAIILGIIIGGCTQVKAETNVPALENIQVRIRGNLDYAWLESGMQFTINIDNATYMGTTNSNVANATEQYLEKYKVLRIRYCNVSFDQKWDNLKILSTTDLGVYGRPKNWKLYDTTTQCTYADRVGYEVEMQYELGFGNGYYNYIDLDNNNYQTQINIEQVFVSKDGGVISKIRYDFIEKITEPKDIYNQNNVIEAFDNLNIKVRGNEDYAYLDPGMEYYIDIDNNNYKGTTDVAEAVKVEDYLKSYKILRIRYCSVSYTGSEINVEPLNTEEVDLINRPRSWKIYQTSTPCYYANEQGYEVEMQYELANGFGYWNYNDGKYQTRIGIRQKFRSINGGIIGKIRYDFISKYKTPNDTNEDATARIESAIEDIINDGYYKKPERDEVLSEYEDKEEELWEIIGVPNYNDINIDIDGNTNNKIWNLIVYILRQNTAILTMVITILSISILKLILNR